MKKYRIKSQAAGFALFTVILVFAVVFTLGSAILFASTSEHRFTAIDSYRQSAYYIAESGVYLLESEIKQWIEDEENQNKSEEEFLEFLEEEKNYKNEFKEGSTHQEISLNVTVVPLVKEEGASVNTQLYQIISTGSVNGFEKVVYQDFEIRREVVSEENERKIVTRLSGTTNKSNIEEISTHSTLIVENGEVFLGNARSIESSKIYFVGNKPLNINQVQVLGERNGTVYSKVDLNFGWGARKDIKAQLIVDGDLLIIDADLYDDIYVSGNLILNNVNTNGNNIFVRGDVTLEGNSSAPNVYYYGRKNDYRNHSQKNQADFNRMTKDQKENLEKKINWDLPIEETVTLREDEWYLKNNFEKNIVKFEDDSWIEYKLVLENRVIIISENNILIDGLSSATEYVLIAPNGEIIMPRETGQYTFNGFIISQQGSTPSFKNINFLSIQDLWPNSQDTPFQFSNPDENQSVDSSSDQSVNIHFNRRGHLREKS